MALDGITIAALVNELKNTLVNGRITKIAQPEKDELLLTIKQSINNSDGSTLRFQKRLTASVNPSFHCSISMMKINSHLCLRQHSVWY